MIVHKTTKRDVDDLFLSMYSEWLMEQPEARICNGDDLIRRIEGCWELERFLKQLPTQLELEVRAHLGEQV